MSEIDAPIETIRTAHTAMESRAAKAEAEKATLLTTVATLTTERTTLFQANTLLAGQNTDLKSEVQDLRDKLAACEAAGGGGSVPEPPVEPPTTPTGTKPKILDERFTNGVDWSRFYVDEGGGPGAPRDRFVKTAEGLKIIYIANSPAGTKRTEIGIRRDPGTDGETPRRDPVGSERWYGFEFFIPTAYKLDDSMADNKRVLWQAHQSGSGITNPPLSLELRNGTLRLVRSVGTERDELLDPDSDPDGIVCTKNVWHRLIVHTLWGPTNGWIECWLDGLHKPKVNKRMCTASGDGLNIKCGSYQPGAASFPSGYRIEYLIRRFAIGDQSNNLASFA